MKQVILSEKKIIDEITEYLINKLNEKQSYYYLIPEFTLKNVRMETRYDLVLFHIKFGLYFFEIKKDKQELSLENPIIYQVKYYEKILENFLNKEKFPINYKIIFSKDYKKQIDKLINKNILFEINKKIFFKVGEKLVSDYDFYYFLKVNPIF